MALTMPYPTTALTADAHVCMPNFYYHCTCNIVVENIIKYLNLIRFRGSRHTDERTFIFGEHPTFYQIDNYNYTAEELRLMDEMMAVWANFAKTG